MLPFGPTGPTLMLDGSQPLPDNVGDANAGKFSSVCFYTGRTVREDPIVFPGVSPAALTAAGKGHLHDFVGNVLIDDSSTPATLTDNGSANTNCVNSDDHAAYWAPTLYAAAPGGTLQQVHPDAVTVYYLANKKAMVAPFPYGLEMIVGNSDATGPDPNNHYFYGCSTMFPTTYDFAAQGAPACTTTQEQHIRTDFPDCWNGVDLVSKSATTPGAPNTHMAYSVKGVCPAGFPIPVPELSILWKYPTPANYGSTITLSSGPYYTMHADFINAWDPFEMGLLTHYCVDATIHCASDHSTPSPTTVTMPGPDQ
jgi:hypothetical protein